MVLEATLIGRGQFMIKHITHPHMYQSFKFTVLGKSFCMRPHKTQTIVPRNRLVPGLTLCQGVGYLLDPNYHTQQSNASMLNRLKYRALLQTAGSPNAFSPNALPQMQRQRQRKQRRRQQQQRKGQEKSRGRGIKRGQESPQRGYHP